MSNGDLKQRKQDVEFVVNGQTNIKEALGFLKDWVSSLVGIQTAAIGAIAVFLELDKKTTLTIKQATFLYGTVVAFVLSIIFGGIILYMLPGSRKFTSYGSQKLLKPYK